MSVRLPSAARSLTLGVVGSLVLALTATPAVAASYRTTSRVSSGLSAGAYGPAAINGAGSFTVFISASSAELPGNQPGPHIYRKDVSNQTLLVDQNNGGVAADGPPDSADVANSGRVVFASAATNLDPADTNDARDVFVRSYSPTATTTRISTPSAIQSGDGDSFEPTISNDGTKVAFVSLASNLVGTDANGSSDVFTADAAGGNLKLVSTGDGSTMSANGNSYRARMSGNGQHVAFISAASDLVAGDTGGFTDVFVYDSVKNDVVRVSVSGAGVAGNGNSGSYDLSISDGGRYVAFGSDATNLVAGDTNGKTDVFVHDRDADADGIFDETDPGARATFRIGGNGDSDFPQISGNGRVVLFRSEASNLVAGDTNGIADLFVARTDGTGISRINVPTSLTQSSGLTFPWGATTDGTKLLFETDASLEAGDTNAVTDVYIHRFEPPATPTLTAPTANQLFATTSVTVAGTSSDPGVSIDIRNASDNALIGTAVTNASSSFSTSITLPTPTAPAGASYTLAVTAKDLPFESAPATRTVRVDTIAPTVNIVAPGNGSTIGESYPTYSGTAGAATGASDDAATVSVVVKAGTVVQESFPSVAVDGSGNWSTVGTVGLPNGTYSVEVTQADAAGNSTTVTNSFTVNAGVPTVTMTAPADGLATNDNTLDVAGTSSLPGGGSPSTTKLNVHAGPTTGGALVAGSPLSLPSASGNWSTALPVLADGLYTLQASATTLAGTGLSGTATVTIDTVAPSIPTIGAPLGPISTNTPTATGTGEPGATLSLSLDGSVFAMVVVPASGNWSVPLGTLADGSHTLAATLQDAAGNTSATANASFSIDLTAPAAPIITTPGEGATLAGPSVGIGGTGEAGATVVVREGTTVLGTSTVTVTGSWSVSVASMANGAHAVTATQTDPAGNVSAVSAVRNFTIDPLAVPTIIHQPLQNSTLTSRDIEVSGTAIGGGSVQLFVVQGSTETAIGAPAAVSASGAWTTTIRRNDGEHTIVARESSGGTLSAQRDFVVDSGIPVIVSPADGSRIPRTNIVTGTARANSSVTVRSGSLTLGSVTSDVDGNFSLTVTLSEGPHTLSAFAGTGQGRTEDSDPVDVTVDASGPVTVVTADDLIMGSATVTPVRISGTASDPAGVSVIEVTYRNVLTNQVVRANSTSGVVCSACGTGTQVTFEHLPSLGFGYWSVEVIAYDRIGNAGARVGTSFLALI
ncbi:MAG: Ig-like domain-containing protein [Actinomycetota bacterium]